MNRLTVTGALFFVAGTLIVLGIVTAEATYPDYSVLQQGDDDSTDAGLLESSPQG